MSISYSQFKAKLEAIQLEFTNNLKSQLNGGVIRVHSDSVMLGRFFTAFIARILRTEIMLACQEMRYDTNEILRKVNRARRARIVLMPNGKYQSIFDHPQKIQNLFKYFGVSHESFISFAEELNLKGDKIQSSQYHILSSPIDASQPGATPRRKPGRPKGSKTSQIEDQVDLREALIKRHLQKWG